MFNVAPWMYLVVASAPTIVFIFGALVPLALVVSRIGQWLARLTYGAPPEGSAASASTSGNDRRRKDDDED